MEIVKREMEYPKEMLELGECVGNIIAKVGVALKDGWQPGEDLPAIIATSFSELIKAVDGINRIPEEFAESYIKATLAVINPIALGIEEMLKLRK